MSCPLELLPNELLDHIIGNLATEPPSQARLHLTPDLHLTRSPDHDKNLKHLSLASHRLRNLVRPVLFAHARLELKDEHEFRIFVTRSGLNRYVTSLVAISSPASAYPDDPSWWRRVLRYLDPARITLLAPPTFIGETLDSPVQGGFNWAFEIDLQIMQLEREFCYPRDLSTHPQYDLERSSNLLIARPWISLTFNESSSLKAYHHYEYFLGRVPSFVGDWGSYLRFQDQGEENQGPPCPPDLTVMLQRFTSFSYIAVFPFFNHMDLILRVMSEMHNLHQLTVQMAPDANNHATEMEQRGSLDPNDPWMELESAYSITGWHVNQHSTISEFQSRDFHVEAVREDLARILRDNMVTGWASDGSGIWRRSLPST
ncbi:hypothetical protein N7532_003937 [Penicillium argentinense]|uniref:F-box domain-containing protein n=1 Tax=Penicillium argentinense TaxID=1131581 RepID=A0A9W9KF60_9EURO|nr:uncharacterized protein N7532_003937 [Penicillium argentinense]KAJ5103408.1 hypothetical protein N7532_003937 [Penicillium argentinense]